MQQDIMPLLEILVGLARDGLCVREEVPAKKEEGITIINFKTKDGLIFQIEDCPVKGKTSVAVVIDGKRSFFDRETLLLAIQLFNDIRFVDPIDAVYTVLRQYNLDVITLMNTLLPPAIREQDTTVYQLDAGVKIVVAGLSAPLPFALASVGKSAHRISFKNIKELMIRKGLLFRPKRRHIREANASLNTFFFCFSLKTFQTYIIPVQNN